MMETIFTVVAIGLSFIFVFVLIIVCYVWYLFVYQMKAISKKRYLESQHGEGN